MNYEELKNEIDEVLVDFFNYELPLVLAGNFDYEYMYHSTDAIINLIKTIRGI